LVSTILVGAGVFAIVMLPKENACKPVAQVVKRGAFRQVQNLPAFRIVAGGMALCNIGNVLAATQLAPMLVDQGITAAGVGGLVSLFGIAVIIGRLLSGLALDSLSTPLVAAVGMCAPAIGLALLGLNIEGAWVIAAGVALVGLSQGAEGDVGGYIAARYIGREFFGTALGLILGVTSASSAIGALILSRYLGASDSYDSFLILCAVLTALGAALFALLSRSPPIQSANLDKADAIVT
jgi:predicted MFS family arabinose efflux permease